ncbi:hypothetical protein GQ55_3G419200 [Panicum hallii var. hallii]|uniref:Uncharacterized protein n=1 Tax=Panicum hallii var. hallii TaxID=1504633 RepID=A0A2T7EHD4_9POAL|nr:hypothetical protein GQ55_3G419200 [Panicum hallii var. hallii]
MAPRSRQPVSLALLRRALRSSITWSCGRTPCPCVRATSVLVLGGGGGQRWLDDKMECRRSRVKEWQEGAAAGGAYGGGGPRAYAYSAAAAGGIGGSTTRWSAAVAASRSGRRGAARWRLSSPRCRACEHHVLDALPTRGHHAFTLPSPLNRSFALSLSLSHLTEPRQPP